MSKIIQKYYRKNKILHKKKFVFDSRMVYSLILKKKSFNCIVKQSLFFLQKKNKKFSMLKRLANNYIFFKYATIYRVPKFFKKSKGCFFFKTFTQFLINNYSLLKRKKKNTLKFNFFFINKKKIKKRYNLNQKIKYFFLKKNKKKPTDYFKTYKILNKKLLINLFYLNAYFINFCVKEKKLNKLLKFNYANNLIYVNNYQNNVPISYLIQNKKKINNITKTFYGYTKNQQKMISIKKNYFFIKYHFFTLQHKRLTFKKYSLKKRYKQLMQKKFLNSWESSTTFITILTKNKRLKTNALILQLKKMRFFFKKKNNINKRKFFFINNLFYSIKKNNYMQVLKKNQKLFNKHLQNLKLYLPTQQIMLKPFAAYLNLPQRYHLFSFEYNIKFYLFFFSWIKNIYKEINLRQKNKLSLFFNLPFLVVIKKPYTSFFFWTALTLSKRKILLFSKTRSQYIKKLLKSLNIYTQQQIFIKRCYALWLILNKKNFIVKRIIKWFKKIKNVQKKYKLKTLKKYVKKIYFIFYKLNKNWHFQLNFFLKAFISNQKKSLLPFLIKKWKIFIKKILYFLNHKKNYKIKNFFHKFLYKFQNSLHKATVLRHMPLNKINIISFYFFNYVFEKRQKKELKYFFLFLNNKNLKHLTLKKNHFLNTFLYKNIKSLELIKLQINYILFKQKVMLSTLYFKSYWDLFNIHNNIFIKNCFFKTFTYLNTSCFKKFHKNKLRKITYLNTTSFWSFFFKVFESYNNLLLKKFFLLKLQKKFSFKTRLFLFLFTELRVLLLNYIIKQLDFFMFKIKFLLKKINKKNLLYIIYASAKNNYFILFYLYIKQQKFFIHNK